MELECELVGAWALVLGLVLVLLVPRTLVLGLLFVVCALCAAALLCCWLEKLKLETKLQN